MGGKARGYVCENYGAKFTLPNRGPIGANCLANPRDFKTPVAAWEDKETDCRIHVKWCGRFYVTGIDHSPLDVVAWHGNYAPYKYDLRTFSPVGAILFDHPDPSIFTVLTAPSGEEGTANIDFVIFPPRWMVAEHTFRPPWYHRNIMSEFMGLIHGQYDAKEEGFVPGGMSLHNMMLPHGPDAMGFEKATTADLKPVKLDDTMAFMFETRFPQHLTRYATELETLQDDYIDCWTDLEKKFDGTPIEGKWSEIKDMKLATLRNGTRDGKLVVVSNDLTRCTVVNHIAATLAGRARRLDEAGPRLERTGRRPGNGSQPTERFHEHDALSPLPRAYQWADGSAYVNHVELVRKARNAEMPQSFWTDPLMYQGGSDSFLAPREPIRMADEAWGIDMEGEVAVIVDDVPMGATVDEARDAIRLVMLVNDVSLRGLIPAELAKGFGFFQSQAVHGLFAGRRDARRTGRCLGRRQAASAAAGRSQRQAVRSRRCRRRHDLRFPAADRPCGQDAAAVRRHDRRLGHGVEQARRRAGQAGRRRWRRLFLHCRDPHHRDDRDRQTEDAVHALRRHGAHRDEGQRTGIRSSAPSSRQLNSTGGKSAMAKQFASAGDMTEKKISFSEIGRDLWAFTAEGDPNTGVIIGDDSVMIVDAQATPRLADKVIEKVRSVTDKPIKYVVLTHYHAVRVLGASAYGADADHRIGEMPLHGRRARPGGLGFGIRALPAPVPGP